MLTNIKPKFVFPATLIFGAGSELTKTLKELTLSLGHPVTPNPDCLVLTPDTEWGIGAVRLIDQFFSLRPYQYPTRLVIIFEAEALENPAQNALLKTIENPGPACHLILTTRYPARILETIRSRCHQINTLPSSPTPSTPSLPTNLLEVDQFLSTSPNVRLYFESLLAYYQAQILTNSSPATTKAIDTIIYCLSLLDHRVDPKLALDYFVLTTFPA
ncbi:MAG: hypothetical protein WCT01_02020 [Candidatus Shapirobacteria bacterium]